MGRHAQNWFVAQLRPNGLKRAEENLGRQGFRSFCPKRMESRSRSGSLAAVSRSLFPGYLFIQFDPKHSGWRAINATRGVSRLILPDMTCPSGLPEQFMTGLMARCDEMGIITDPPDNLKPGETVRIVSGPFAETIAKIEDMDGADRIRILMELMGQATTLSVPKSKVEKL